MAATERNAMKRLLLLMILLCSSLYGCSAARSFEVFFDEQNRMYGRETIAYRGISPLGPSANETIAKIEPFTIETDTVKLKGQSGGWTWLDTLWQTIKDWAWIGLGGVLLLLVLRAPG